MYVLLKCWYEGDDYFVVDDSFVAMSKDIDRLKEHAVSLANNAEVFIPGEEVPDDENYFDKRNCFRIAHLQEHDGIFIEEKQQQNPNSSTPKEEKKDKYYYEDGTVLDHWVLDDPFRKMLHRVGAPAVELADGTKRWYINDKLHRTNGPAVEWPNGKKEWYLYDIKYSKEEFEYIMKHSMKPLLGGFEQGGFGQA